MGGCDRPLRMQQTPLLCGKLHAPGKSLGIACDRPRMLFSCDRPFMARILAVIDPFLLYGKDSCLHRPTHVILSIYKYIRILVYWYVSILV